MSMILQRTRDIVTGKEDQAYLWMLPFSTLMLVLMILFTALYSAAQLNSVDYESAMSVFSTSEERAERSKREVELAESLDHFIQEMEMDGIAEVTITAHNIKLKLSSPVIFDSGSAEVKPDVMPLMIKLLGHLKDMKNTIIVEGHTDNVPITGGRYESNWELSAARAFSVIYFYIQRGIEPERLVAHGYGDNRPLYPNDTELGRAINRRIEITILRGE